MCARYAAPGTHRQTLSSYARACVLHTTMCDQHDARGRRKSNADLRVIRFVQSSRVYSGGRNCRPCSHGIGCGTRAREHVRTTTSHHPFRPRA